MRAGEVGARPGTHLRVPLVVLLIALAMLTSSCASSKPSTPIGGNSSTIATSCPRFGSTAGEHGAGKVSSSSQTALLRNVQIQATSCADEVRLLFSGGVPGYSVSYRTGALYADPSGQPVRVGGAFHLVIRLSPASGVDLTGTMPHITYDGPTTLDPRRPSGVVEMKRLGDFESVLTWAVGVSSREPFGVTARGDQFVIRLSPNRPRNNRCALSDAPLTAGYPAAWYTELSNRWPCQYFNRVPFSIQPSSDAMPWSVTIERSSHSASKTVAGLRKDSSSVHSSSTSIAGYSTTVLDVTTSGKAMYPSDYVFRAYVIALRGNALVVQSTPGPPGPPNDRRRADALVIAKLLRRRS